MLLDLQPFVELAGRQYRDFSALRVKDRGIDEVVTSQHAITIPPSLQGRAMPVYGGIAAEKEARACVLLTDPQGMQHIIGSLGAGTKAKTDKEKVENWLTGVWQQVAAQAMEDPEDFSTHDLVRKARGCLRVMPHFAAWQGMPDPETELNLDDDTTVDEVVERVSRVLTAQERRKRQRLPILVEWVPAECVWPERDAYGLAVMWDFRQMTVKSVLDTYVSESGEPLATGLAAAVERDELTDSDVCNVVIRADREHVQIVVVGFLFDDTGEDATRWHGGEEVVWQGPHGMGAVPYAFAPGRVRPVTDVCRRYHGLLDDAVSLCVMHDWFATQYATNVRQASWTQMQEVQQGETQPPPLFPKEPGGGDETPRIEINEGDVYINPPGAELRPIPWLTPNALRDVGEAMDRLEARIDKLTIGAASYGLHGANSGYELALQQVGAESPLEPFARGKARLFARADDLLIRAARALMREGSGPIPVRRQTQDGTVRWETLTEDLADQDWDIQVVITPRQQGGEMANAQVAAFLEDRGYIDHEEAVRRTGNRHPQLTAQQVLIDGLRKNPQVMEFVMQQAMAGAMANFANQAPPELPPSPMLSSAAAGVLGQMNLPENVRARMPAGLDKPVGPPMPGMPQMPGGTPAAERPPLPGLGAPGAGNPVGQGLALPGGLARQAQTLG